MHCPSFAKNSICTSLMVQYLYTYTKFVHVHCFIQGNLVLKQCTRLPQCQNKDKNCQGNSIEICAYIKNHTKVGHSAKSVYNEIVNIYGDNIFCRRHFYGWAKQFPHGREPLENEPKLGQRISKTTKQTDENIKELKTDARYTLRELAKLTKMTGISSSKLYFILKRSSSYDYERLQLGGSHISSLKNKRGHVFLMRINVEALSKLLQEKISDIVMSYGTGTHFFEPQSSKFGPQNLPKDLVLPDRQRVCAKLLCPHLQRSWRGILLLGCSSIRPSVRPSVRSFVTLFDA